LFNYLPYSNFSKINFFIFSNSFAVAFAITSSVYHANNSFKTPS
jgi:hypothetical protein